MTLKGRLLASSLARPRPHAVLLGNFAVLSHIVAQRTREPGVRAALGPSRLDRTRLVMRQGLTVTAAGLVLGLSAAALLTRLTEVLPYGVSPADGVTYAGVATLVLLVAALACFIPALRAARSLRSARCAHAASRSRMKAPPRSLGPGSWLLRI